jgi:hypothetical protein
MVGACSVNKRDEEFINKSTGNPERKRSLGILRLKV